MSGRNVVARLLAGVQVLSLTLMMFSGALAGGKKGKQPETIYSNPTSIAISTIAASVTTPTVAATYPSQIAVSGMAGNTTRVAVTLNGFNHLVASQLDFLLVSPTGVKFVFASDLSGGSFGAVDKVYTFADDAATTLPANSLISGSYKPTSGDANADTFPAPAPAGPYNLPPNATFASSFNGVSPNGNWSLYVVDDNLGSGGNLYDGWSLDITTDSSPATVFANTSVINVNDAIAMATPYGSTINVTGATGVISNLKVTLFGVTHGAPGDIDVLLVSPNGKSLVLMSDVSNTAASNADLTFDDAASGFLNTVVTGTYKPSDSIPESDTFNYPAPPRPYLSGTNNPLNSFNGYSPNGGWTLYVVDDAPNTSSGTIAGGWSLDITTAAPVPPAPVGCTSPSFSTSNIPVGTGPTNVAIADFNNDGKSDLAVTNQISSDVSILIGNGTGGFSALSPITAGSGPYAIAAGKFNADANFDLAVVNSSSNNVSILLGNGNGTFSAPSNFFVGTSPISIAVADFNGDTKKDLAVANFGGFFNGTVSILLGNGTGGFTAGNTVRARTQPSFVVAGDFNNDSKQDLVVANFGSNNVVEYLGDGLGGFPAQQIIANLTGPVAIEAANFLGNDAFLDLAIAQFNADSMITYVGSGSGTFTPSVNANIGSNPVSITSGDFNQDGSVLLAVALSGANTVRVGSNPPLPVGLNPNAVEAGSFNADSKPDIVAVNSGSNDISVMLNICQVATGNLMDFNGDRRTDIMTYRASTNAWWSYPGPSPFIHGRSTDKTVPADYDGDRVTDYAIYRPETNQWYVMDRFGRPLHFLTFGVAGDIPAPGDYDGDGKADIAVFRPSNGNWYIRFSTDNLTSVANWGMNGDAPVAADYDGDGKDDIAVFRPSTGVWYVFRSSDSQAAITAWGMSGDKTVAGDYDGDGKADLAIWRPSDGAWYALRSSDSGVQAYYWGLTGDYPVVGDFDGDGKYDFSVWRPGDQIWYVLRSSDGVPSYTQWGLSADYPVPNSFVR